MFILSFMLYNTHVIHTLLNFLDSSIFHFSQVFPSKRIYIYLYFTYYFLGSKLMQHLPRVQFINIWIIQLLFYISHEFCVVYTT